MNVALKITRRTKAHCHVREPFPCFLPCHSHKKRKDWQENHLQTVYSLQGK